MWQKIKEKAQLGRRTGIGITAEGDMLAALGLRYGSDEGIKFSVDLHKMVAIEAYRASVQAAKERGAFELFNADREKDNPFMLRLKEADAQLYYEMLEFGRRNIALLTIAPTGTTSLMSQTSSGIEPVFLPVYKGRRKVNPNDKNVLVLFLEFRSLLLFLFLILLRFLVPRLLLIRLLRFLRKIIQGLGLRLIGVVSGFRSWFNPTYILLAVGLLLPSCRSVHIAYPSVLFVSYRLFLLRFWLQFL